MKKRVIRLFTLWLLVATAAFVSTGVAVHAQSASSLVRASIPFDFTVGDKTLPAGDYLWQRVWENSDSVMKITSRDGHRSVTFMTHSVIDNKNQTGARLVFRRYGSEYFLAQVWTGFDSSGRELHRSAAERAIERQLAQNASANETVTVIAGRE